MKEMKTILLFASHNTYTLRKGSFWWFDGCTKVSGHLEKQINRPIVYFLRADDSVSLQCEYLVVQYIFLLISLVQYNA